MDPPPPHLPSPQHTPSPSPLTAHPKTLLMSWDGGCKVSWIWNHRHLCLMALSPLSENCPQAWFPFCSYISARLECVPNPLAQRKRNKLWTICSYLPGWCEDWSYHNLPWIKETRRFWQSQPNVLNAAYAVVTAHYGHLFKWTILKSAVYQISTYKCTDIKSRRQIVLNRLEM